MDTTTDNKLLSIVLCGKNDNYLGDFTYRITTCLNYLCKNVEETGRRDEVEIIITDWGSDIPLSQGLSLSSECADLCSFVYVPHSICSIFNTDGQSFNAHCAMNTAIRRSNGKYIMLMPADVLVPAISIQNILLLLDGKLNPCFDPTKTMLNIGRKEVPWQIVAKQPTFYELDRYIQLHNRHMIYDTYYPGLMGCYGAIMMHRSMWYECDGCLEDRAGHGWTDIELGFRITQRYPYVDLGGFGIYVYDMQQKFRLRSALTEIKSSNIRKTIKLDNPDWGLGNYELEIQRSSFNCETDSDACSYDSLVNNSIVNHEIVTFAQVRRFIKGRGSFLNIWRKKDGEKLIRHRSEWAALNAVAWCTLNFLPMRYLEFGIRNGYTASIASLINAGMEIYGIDEWNGRGNRADKDPFRFPSTLFHANKFQGYVRFITGDRFTALQRLKDSFVGDMLLDMILFRCDMFGHDSPEQIDMLSRHLSNSGCLIITAIDPSLFMDAFLYIGKKHPYYLSIDCREYNTGIFISTKGLSDVECDRLKSLKSDLQKEWKPDWFFMYSTYLISKFISKVVWPAGRKMHQLIN